MDIAQGQSRRLSKDIIYNTLKDQIINGILKPDTSIVEEHISEQLQVSRTPLREALQRLEMNQLVVRQSNGRLKVTPLSVEEVKELFEIRSMLEGIVVKSAVKHATRRDVFMLRNIVEQMKIATENNSQEDLLYFGHQFHSLIYSLGKNKTAANILSSLNDRILRYKNLIPKEDTGRKGQTIEEHQKIVDLIEKGDEINAERATREHIMNSLSVAIKRIEAFSDEE